VVGGEVGVPPSRGTVISMARRLRKAIAKAFVDCLKLRYFPAEIKRASGEDHSYILPMSDSRIIGNIIVVLVFHKYHCGFTVDVCFSSDDNVTYDNTTTPPNIPHHGMRIRLSLITTRTDNWWWMGGERETSEEFCEKSVESVVEKEIRRNVGEAVDAITATVGSYFYC